MGGLSVGVCGTSNAGLGPAEGAAEKQKACTKCRVDKPLSAFFKDPQKRDGVMCWCRSCCAAQAQARKAAWQQQLTGEEVDFPNTLYRCVLCGTEKPIDDFSRKQDCLDLRCRACRTAQREARAALLGQNGQPPTHKECARCQVLKPASAFKRHKLTSTGLDSWCKECCVERKKAGPPAARIRVTQPTLACKRCVQCQLVVATEDFTRDLTKPSGLGLRCKVSRESIGGAANMQRCSCRLRSWAHA